MVVVGLSVSLGGSKIFMKKIYSFAKRFHSPKIHCLEEFIYLIGGSTIENQSLTHFSKISLSEAKIQNHIPLQEMINVRSGFQSMVLENSKEIYVFGGKILKNNQFQIQNGIFDLYDIQTNSWKEVQIQGFSSDFKENLIDFVEINEDCLFIFGGESIFEVDTCIGFAHKTSLKQSGIHEKYEKLTSILKNSRSKLALEEIWLNREKDKNLIFLKYYE